MLAELHKLGMGIKRETLNRYIQILLDAKILYECKRFDLKSKKSIRGEQKYYLSDLGFYFANNTDNRINYGPALENIVYNYAKTKGFSISQLIKDTLMERIAEEYDLEVCKEYLKMKVEETLVTIPFEEAIKEWDLE